MEFIDVFICTSRRDLYGLRRWSARRRITFAIADQRWSGVMNHITRRNWISRLARRQQFLRITIGRRRFYCSEEKRSSQQPFKCFTYLVGCLSDVGDERALNDDSVQFVVNASNGSVRRVARNWPICSCHLDRRTIACVSFDSTTTDDNVWWCWLKWHVHETRKEGERLNQWNFHTRKSRGYSMTCRNSARHLFDHVGEGYDAMHSPVEKRICSGQD